MNPPSPQPNRTILCPKSSCLYNPLLNKRHSKGQNSCTWKWCQQQHGVTSWDNLDFYFFLVKKAGRTKVGLQLIAEVSINIMHSLQSLSISQCIYIYIPSSAMPSAYCLPWALPTDREVWGSLCGGWGATDGKSK